MSTVAENRLAEAAAQSATFDAFRRWGYLQADLDPLRWGLKPEPHPELDLDGPEAERAREIYCGTIGVEFMHIPDPEKRRWIAERMENPTRVSPEQQRFILERLVSAEVFEQTLQQRYLGSKRFSLEGVTALIPMLDQIIECAIEKKSVQAVLAMSHRGRLTVISHTVSRPASEIFAGFEDVDPRSVLGGGDVKYHIGSTGTYKSRSGGEIKIHLVSNPSHLEAVDPVAYGRTKAKQIRHGDKDGSKILLITMHGDAAFAGQGIWAETLNLATLQGYNVHGAIHIISNNLLGFTASPRETWSSRFSSDVAKRLAIPIFHVNAEDPEAVIKVARMAVEYRYTFDSEIVVDLIGFRRHGHSEVDDASITQPVLYRKIKEHPDLHETYARQIGVDPAPIVERVKAELDEAQREAKSLEKRPVMYSLPDYWSPYKGGRYSPDLEVPTALSRERLRELAHKLAAYPSEFHIHPKIKKLLEQRAEMGDGKRPLDYGMGEALAFASLLTEGTPVRLTGQDSRRGTFNHRHAVLIDVEDEHIHIPLCHLAPDQARFDVYNSELSEAGVMGFEYGYSRDYPETLVLWEAQFGDFANGAQIVIDQFISAGEDKWDLLSGLVLLLPHGYEGQGPEHSSARIERYLQLCAKDNMTVGQPSNSANYFHLLRRQAKRAWRKPLICFTPKSMLRHPEASSPIDDLANGAFRPVVSDPNIQDAERVLLCTGKIGHELNVERKKRKDDKTAIVFLDQLYPFPEHEIAEELARHPNAREITWVQEEPANMGALWFVVPRLRRLAAPRGVLTVKRSASASPATGSAKAHELEQKTLIALAFAGAGGTARMDGGEGGSPRVITH
jgi:2-oxoglutarate dehydrogenase E1 component